MLAIFYDVYEFLVYSHLLSISEHRLGVLDVAGYIYFGVRVFVERLGRSLQWRERLRFGVLDVVPRKKSELEL